MSAGGGLNEIGFYCSGAAVGNPRELVVEVGAAEAMGLGAAFVPERFTAQEAVTVSGALGAVTSRLGLATLAASPTVRHPLAAASHALTMHKITGGRYSLGIGRGATASAARLGLDPVTTARLADYAWLVRRLWAGETVVGHDGPAGRFPELSLGLGRPERIPMTLSAIGPRSLTLAGRVFDAAVLHPFLTEDATRAATATVRQAAAESGRDPATVRVWSVLTVAADDEAADAKRRRMVARLATHLHTMGELLVATNGWDPAKLQRFENDLFVRSFDGPIEGRASDSELDHLLELLPSHWLATTAFGSPADTAAAIVGQLDCGVDGVILHGASPWELESVAAAYRRVRDGPRFAHLPANPAVCPPVPPARPDQTVVSGTA